MNAKRKVQFIVGFTLPPGATVREAKTYIKDAVESLHGARRPPGALSDEDPGDPMFLLDANSITVKSLAKMLSAKGLGHAT